MRIQEHISLKELTTMKIGGIARYFCSAKKADELAEAFSFAREKGVPVVVLGGGSNILISGGELNALVVKIDIKGIKWGSYSPFSKGSTPILIEGRDLNPPSRRLDHPPLGKEESEDSVLAVVGAGESWDGLVAEAVKRGLWGIENLSGIPGTLGAAPIQNIGAYGTEVKEVTEWVEVFDTVTGEMRKLVNADCRFAYRDSIFKHTEGKSLVVTKVALRLRKHGVPNLEYKDLRAYFGNSYSPFPKGSTPSSEEGFKSSGLADSATSFKKGGIPTLADIRKAVLEIRGRKFPDLKTHGTAGSFFKNPIVSKEKYGDLKRKFPNLPSFPLSSSPLAKGALPSSAGGMSDSFVKIPLAWILDNICGLKGYKKGNVRLFEKQPIVLVQNGLASAEEIETFAEEIEICVKEKTGIEIEWEVQRIS